jgi:hypothetical protein
MKLTDIVKNPELKSIGTGKYHYLVKFKGDKKSSKVNGHMNVVHDIVEGLLTRKMVTIKFLNELKACASYHLLVEVTDLKDDDVIKSMLAQAGWQNRYSVKHKFTVDDKTYIICREWVKRRVDILIKGVSDFCKVESVQLEISED